MFLRQCSWPVPWWNLRLVEIRLDTNISDCYHCNFHSFSRAYIFTGTQTLGFPSSSRCRWEMSAKFNKNLPGYIYNSIQQHRGRENISLSWYKSLQIKSILCGPSICWQTFLVLSSQHHLKSKAKRKKFILWKPEKKCSARPSYLCSLCAVGLRILDAQCAFLLEQMRASWAAMNWSHLYSSGI